MPQGMANAIEVGSTQSTLLGESWNWKFVLSGWIEEPGGAGEFGGETTLETIIFAGTDGSFTRSGTTLTFVTSEDIEIENNFDGVSHMTIKGLTGYIRIDGVDYTVIPKIPMNITIEWSQTLRITEITLGVND